MSTDYLWTEASEDHEGIAHHVALARADAELTGVMPFLFAASSWHDYANRKALAEHRLRVIALACGLDEEHVASLADEHMKLYVEARSVTALPEGVDPLGPVVDASQASGGPEKPDEHSEGPDFSHGYSEVPQGAPGGPNPAVANPRYRQPGQVQEATAAKEPVDYSKEARKIARKAAKKAARRALKLAQGPDTPGPNPIGQVGGQPNLPAGVSPTAASPDGMGPGGMMQPAPAAPGAAQQLSQRPTTARLDPVAEQIRAVASSVAASNPALPQDECRRLARTVVGQYLRHADLAGSQISDQPVGAPGPGGGGGGQDGGHGMSGLGEYGLGRQLINKLPGAGGAGAAAGVGELAEVAEAAAL